MRAERVEVDARKLGNLLVVYPDCSTIGLEQSDNVLDRNRLSGPRIADEGHSLALLDFEREALEHLFGAEGFVNVDQLDHVTKMGRSTPGGRGDLLRLEAGTH